MPDNKNTFEDIRHEENGMEFWLAREFAEVLGYAQWRNFLAVVGKKVRQTIKELGGTMPEDLPPPEKSIQQLERAKKKALKQGQDKFNDD